MDKIDLSSYFDYTLTDHTAATVSDWWVTEYLTLLAPSPQLINWLTTMGWGTYSYSLTDPTAITDYAIMQRGGFDIMRILQVLVTDFTNSYNEGRDLNDDRFDEIIAVYTALQDKTEDELNLLEDDEDTFESLVNAVISNLAGEYTTHETEIDTDLTNWATSERSRIEDQFDNLLTTMAAKMRRRGIYNTTSWDAVEAGIERERADANTKLEGEIENRTNEIKDRLYNQQVDIRMKFLDARAKLMSQLHAQGNVRTEIRNKIVGVLAAFAERREDDYPSFLEPINSALSVAISEHANGWS